jgi:hypothetical protein
MPASIGLLRLLPFIRSFYWHETVVVIVVRFLTSANSASNH